MPWEALLRVLPAPTPAIICAIALLPSKRSSSVTDELERRTAYMPSEPLRFRLRIPLADAFAFAMGWSDLGYEKVDDGMRHIIGLLVLDSLEYSEQWRASARVRACLVKKWPTSLFP